MCGRIFYGQRHIKAAFLLQKSNPPRGGNSPQRVIDLFKSCFIIRHQLNFLLKTIVMLIDQEIWMSFPPTPCHAPAAGKIPVYDIEDGRTVREPHCPWRKEHRHKKTAFPDPESYQQSGQRKAVVT
jgi:hypothetical protein